MLDDKFTPSATPTFPGTILCQLQHLYRTHKDPYLFLSSISDEEHIVDDAETAASVRHNHEGAVKRTDWVPARRGLFVDAVHC